MENGHGRVTEERDRFRAALLDILELNHPKFPPSASWARYVLREAQRIAVEALREEEAKRENNIAERRAQEGDKR